jgi:hypothetical protein
MTGMGEDSRLVESRMEVIEMEARSNNLMIHGIEESVSPSESNEPGGNRSIPRTNEEASQATLAFCNSHLGVAVTEADISTAFRLQRKGKDKSRPILVKFTSQRVRNLVYAARLSLRTKSPQHSTPIYINEHLTRQNAQLYAKARSLVNQKKVISAWTSAGHVFIRLPEAEGAKKVKISSQRMLDEYLGHQD